MTKRRFRIAVAAALLALVPAVLLAVKLPTGYMSEKDSNRILEKTVTIRMDPDLSQLSTAEREAIPLLLEIGETLHDLYLVMRHHQALSAYEDLLVLDDELDNPPATQNLITMYRLFKGPICRTLDNKVVPFLPVDDKEPGKNVYPLGVDKEEIDRFLAGHPDEAASILGVRSVVRWRSGMPFYAVPYSVAFAQYVIPVFHLLNEAAAVFEKEDPDFAAYLANRAVDLVRDDYEAGDAAWVRGSFGNLNAEIGSYETYDDELYGVKSFFAMSLLVKDPMMSSTVETSKRWLQEMEDLLPYEPHKKVKGDIPIGAYNIIADFGQARGSNTATILPNEAYITRKYGRTILLRNNIMTNPEIFEMRRAAFNAAVSEEFHNDFDPKGGFFRTLWHEIGHYLGPDETKDGRTLDIALEEDSSILEELKADLIALFVSKPLFKKGYYDQTRLRAVQTAGVRRLLQKNQPKKTQAYNTMELMQLNYYLAMGLLEYNPKTKKLIIHYDRYQPTVEAMLREVLTLQYEGDKAAADAFIERYSTWRKDPHERLADEIKKAETYRYVLVRYAALGE
ncbi:MAG: NUDIX hydrolase [bacterium]